MSRSLYARLARKYGKAPSGPTRRRFLQASLAVGAALLLSPTPGCRRDDGAATARRRPRVRPSGPGRHVVVIGAGFAGLTAAHELQAAGYRVTVIEAQGIVGGRVQSNKSWIPGRTVELGGELIGSVHPIWTAYADQFGLEFLEFDPSNEELHYPIVLDGRELSEEESVELYEEMDAAFTRMNADAAALLSADEPWTTPDAEALDRRTMADWLASLEVSDLGRRGLAVQLEADNAVPLERQSYLAMLAQVKGGGVERYWTESEVYRCRGGNQQLAHKLADTIGRRHIHLREPVEAVTLREGGALVETAAGRRLEADDVILTVPPTAWDHITFSPSLPAELRPQMGNAAKYLAAVRERFWRENGIAPEALTDGPIPMTWEATDNQPGEGQAVITCFLSSDAAERATRMEPSARAPFYDGELQKLFPGYMEQVTDRRFIDWPSMPRVGGGYSFPAPGQVTTMGPLLRRGLAGPDGVTRLHFAGEHTSYKFVGYMEGGLDSGAAAARRIAEPSQRLRVAETVEV